jgi:GNAT superfamily N-acetyltransferase
MTSPTTGRFRPATTGPDNHLPGKHDQSSHGRKGGLRSKSAIKSTYERKDAETGLSTKVERITVNGDSSERPGWKKVDIIVYEGGEDVGAATFDISPDGRNVHHSEMVLADGMQGQGFATRTMVHVLDSYHRHGVAEMTLTANLHVGGYAWARAGFDFASPQARSELADDVRRRAGARYDPAVHGEIERVSANPNSSPADFAMIGHSPGAKSWPGKEMLLASTWDAVLRL